MNVALFGPARTLLELERAAEAERERRQIPEFRRDYTPTHRSGALTQCNA